MGFGTCYARLFLLKVHLCKTCVIGVVEDAHDQRLLNFDQLFLTSKRFLTQLPDYQRNMVYSGGQLPISSAGRPIVYSRKTNDIPLSMIHYGKALAIDLDPYFVLST